MHYDSLLWVMGDLESQIMLNEQRLKLNKVRVKNMYDGDCNEQSNNEDSTSIHSDQWCQYYERKCRDR